MRDPRLWMRLHSSSNFSSQIWSRQCCFLVCGIYGQQTKGASLEASHFQNFHLFTAMAAASRDVNKWKRNLTQEMSPEPEDESEPDEPEFETSFRFEQEGDIVAVYNVDFFISEVTRVISEEEAIVNFLEKVAVKMELLCTCGHALNITIKSPPQLCLPRICNLHLHHCLQGRSFCVESPRNLFGRYQALRCCLQENHL